MAWFRIIFKSGHVETIPLKSITIDPITTKITWERATPTSTHLGMIVSQEVAAIIEIGDDDE